MGCMHSCNAFQARNTNPALSASISSCDAEASVVEPKQQGVSTGAARSHSKKRKRSRASPLGANRGSRSKTSAKPKTRSKAARLSPSSQSRLLLSYERLPKPRAARSKALRSLHTEFGVSSAYPAKLTRKLDKSKKLPTRKGVGGRPVHIKGEVLQQLLDTLEENAYDLTFAQLEEETGIPATTIKDYFKRTKGWTVCNTFSSHIARGTSARDALYVSSTVPDSYTFKRGCTAHKYTVLKGLTKL